jgi:hypothetical protein
MLAFALTGDRMRRFTKSLVRLFSRCFSSKRCQREEMSMPRQFAKSLVNGLALASLAMAMPGWAAGSTGAVVPTSILIENGKLYLWSPQFANPDNCASSAVVVVPDTIPKWEAFVSVALTAQTTGKKVTLWVGGCTPTNWYASAPVAGSISIGP